MAASVHPSAFTDREVLPLLESAPAGAFAAGDRRLQATRGEGSRGRISGWVRRAAAQVKWVHFVQSLDGNPRARSALHYVATARLMAEVARSLFEEARSAGSGARCPSASGPCAGGFQRRIDEGVAGASVSCGPGRAPRPRRGRGARAPQSCRQATPFSGEATEVRRAFTVTPARRSLAFRSQARARAGDAPYSGRARAGRSPGVASGKWCERSSAGAQRHRSG